tara:strand:+ start:307 stop:510 length:204 start_codon:yes stop_codon:yes gene_type:complete
MYQNIIEIQGRLFQVKRKFPQNRINLEIEDAVKILKQYYHCDTIFKSQGLIWLCNEVKDINYVEIEK